MKKVTFACIYRSIHVDFDPSSISKDWGSMKIEGNDVTFLIDVLRSQSTFHDITDKVWRLDFFEQSRFRQVLYVSVISVDVGIEELESTKERTQWAKNLQQQADKQIQAHLPSARSVVKATFVQTDNYEVSNLEVLTASQLIRGTNSMEFDTLDRHSDRFIHVDGRGTTLFSPHAFHDSTFKRQVILLALAKGYLFAMNQIMNGLAAECESNGGQHELYKNALIFNAKYFFANPVKINRYDAFQLWQGVRKCTMIDDINNEITQQLKSVHQILNEEDEARQFKSELRLNKRVGWLGIWIGLMSLISLFEITPTKINEFLQNWVDFFTH